MKRKTTKTKQKAASQDAAAVNQSTVVPSTVIPAEVNEQTIGEIRGAVTTNQILPAEKPEPEETPQGPVIEVCKIRFDFPDHELVGLGRQLVRCSRQVEALQNELASIKKDYASRIEKVEVERSRISQILDDGYEMRDVECVVLVYVDRQARSTEKVYYSRLTGAFVRREKVAGGVELDFFTLLPPGQKVEDPLPESFLKKVL